MKQFFLFLALSLILQYMTHAQNEPGIRKTFLDFNTAISNKDIDSAMAVFDDDADIILAGSDIQELHKGPAPIRSFLKNLFAKPFRVSWDFSNMTVDQNQETAWMFAEGKAIIKQDDGQVVTMPYRLTLVMVKKGETWKWRLFNGSVPQAG